MSGLKFLPLLLVSLVVAGCSVFGGLESDVIPPTLVQKSDFPPLPATVTSKTLDLKTDLIISKAGAVVRAWLLNSSGDLAWDSAAVKRIMSWKYSPAMLKGTPIQMRISQAVHVIYHPPLLMILSQIVCTSAGQADSVYADLRAGESFDSLSSVISPTNSVVRSGYVGKVDIRQYSDEIQNELKNLKVNAYTRPLRLGTYYAIFMRHEYTMVEPLPE